MAVLNEILHFFVNFTTHLVLFSLPFILQYRPRRKRLWLFVPGAAAYLLVPYLFKLLSGRSFYSNPIFKIGWYSASYLILCAALAALYCLCFEATAKEAALILCAAYLMQNFLFNVSQLAPALLPWMSPLAYRIVQLLVVLGISLGAYLLLKKSVLQFDISRVKTPVALAFLIGLLLLVTVISQWVTTLNRPGSYNATGASLYAAVASLALLIALFVVFGNSRLKYENGVISQLLGQAEKQHKISQDKIEYINQRVHDLKHQIAAIQTLLSQGEERAEIQDKLTELEKTAKVYDDIVLTGNNILDTLLTEQKLRCDQYQIQMDYVIDGTLLNFMEPMDVYVIFGNAIDNAVESLIQIPDASKRILSIAVEKRGRLVNISVENYFENDLVLLDGLPVTSKRDKAFHGFGIKSIQFIARKYGGHVTISAQQRHFCLSVLLPVRDAPAPEDSALEKNPA